MAMRALDRRALWRALLDAQLVSGPVPEADAAPLDATLELVAGASCVLVMFPIEDLIGIAEQPNLPGTFDQHPNWRRRLAQTVTQILARADVKDRLKLVQQRRRGES
jgi:4-alpha-glucanotransferase